MSALEVEDLVTVRDVATVLQRAEMVRRIADEIEGYVIELGADGRLVMLQLEELIGGVEDDRRLVAKDYFSRPPTSSSSDVMRRSPSSRTKTCSTWLGRVGAAPRSRDRPRRRAAAARLPAAAQDPAAARARSDHVVDRFSNLQKIMRAGLADLMRSRASARCGRRAIKDGLSRLAETCILERYV